MFRGVKVGRRMALACVMGLSIGGCGDSAPDVATPHGAVQSPSMAAAAPSAGERSQPAAEPAAPPRRFAAGFSFDEGTTRPAPAPLTAAEVLVLVRGGAADEVIIDRIERSDSVFRMTAAEENALHRQGLSDDVITAMKENCRQK